MSIQVGATIGSYRVEQRIGAGGMGEVWRVTDIRTGQTRALKTLLKGGQPDEQNWRRFLSEGRIHSEISHPGVAAFHEMFLYENRPCIVMEFVAGETLHERIHRLGRLSADEVRWVMESVARALAYLHSKGILHRDLKTANVKITFEGNVKLLDFGIARYRLSSRLTQEGMVIGTLENLAPEVLSGQTADERSEVWAIGLLGYEMLTGRPPFAGADPGTQHVAIVERDPVAPSSLVPGIPADLERAVMRCLEKDPARRFSSCDTLARSLAIAPAAPSRKLPDIPRAWLAGAAAVLLLFVAVWMFSGGDSAGGGDRTVTVEVTNGSAEVWENGRLAGETPFVRKARMGEDVRLVLKRDGFYEQPVQFEVTERKAYSFTMVPRGR